MSGREEHSFQQWIWKFWHVPIRCCFKVTLTQRFSPDQSFDRWRQALQCIAPRPSALIVMWWPTWSRDNTFKWKRWRGLDKGPAAATAKFLSTSQVEFNQLWEGSQVELCCFSTNHSIFKFFFEFQGVSANPGKTTSSLVKQVMNCLSEERVRGLISEPRGTWKQPLIPSVRVTSLRVKDMRY